MKLDKLAEVLMHIKKEFKLDDTDIMLLGCAAKMEREQGEVSTMGLIGTFKEASECTTHTRIKKLCDKKILNKMSDKSNQRTKMIVAGDKFGDLLNYLSGVK